MHKRRADFDPLKFTPSVIANKKEIDIHTLSAYFLNGHTLSECAEYFKCSQVTIKRRLRTHGVDTSIYNHSRLAKDRAKAKLAKPQPSDQELYDLYVTQCRDTKSIAEMFGLHYQTIRKRIQMLGIKKDPHQVSKSQTIRHQHLHGCKYPAQRIDVIKSTRRSTVKAVLIDKRGRLLEFRSLHELCFALLLDYKGLEWYYEEMSIPYIDMMAGKSRMYIVDFTVVDGDLTEWIEVKPNNNMIPTDKRIFAERRAQAAGVIYRGLYDDERKQGWELFLSGYGKVDFKLQPPSKTQKKITYWFKDKLEVYQSVPNGWKLVSLEETGRYYKGVLKKL